MKRSLFGAALPSHGLQFHTELNNDNMKVLLLLTTLVFTACFQLTLGAPLGLLSMVPARNYDVPRPPLHGNHVHVGEPQLIPEPNSDTFICLFQEIDGNLHVLRSLSKAGCDNNDGDVLYESGVHLPLADETYEYFTRMQWSGNLFTQKFVTDSGEKGSIGVWKTIAPQWYDHKAFTLVLNDDDTLSIMLENTTSIWDSPSGESCLTGGKRGGNCAVATVDPVSSAAEPVTTTAGPLMTTAEPVTTTTEPVTTVTPPETTTTASRPLILMKAGTRVLTDAPIAVPDPLTGTYACVIQKANANFVVSQGDNCDSIDESSIVFQSYTTLSGIDAYYTHLQHDGNLVTRRQDSEKVVWRSRSNQGRDVRQEFVLVITASDTLAILNEDGRPIWDSAQDISCSQANLRKRL